MNLMQPTTIKSLLEKYGSKPNKGLGQNFLINAAVLENIIQAAEILPTDTILEVGPGLGVLTKALAQKAQRVIAVEKDHVMVNILQETLAEYSNTTIVQENILTSTIELPDYYKIVANIPYYLTSPLIRKYLEANKKPTSMVLMIQKEVAERICAKPGDMSILAVSVQYYTTPTIIAMVSKSSFWPAPKVDSAIIKIVPLAQKTDTNDELFFTVVKAGFSAPRKQLANNLSTALKLNKEVVHQWLAKNNLEPQQRAETLSLQDWVHLTQSYKPI